MLFTSETVIFRGLYSVMDSAGSIIDNVKKELIHNVVISMLYLCVLVD